MNNSLFKGAILAGCAVLGAATAHAEEARGFYVGGFGGVGRSDDQHVEQTGVAHKRGNFNHGYPDFDLKVDVDGKVEHETASLFGFHSGYEWAIPSTSLNAAFELEGVYYKANQRSALENPATELLSNVVPYAGQLHTSQDLAALVEEEYGAGEHRFANTMDMKMGLFMANGVLSKSVGSKMTPYIGAGVGLAAIEMKNAVSHQTNPSGPIELAGGEQVNHFNSKDHATALTFAAQGKAGVRYALTNRISVFGEYRYIRVSHSDFTFGSTVYAEHSPTDNWNLHNGTMNLHNALVGIDFAL